MPNWTKEQSSAIELEGCNLLISAGAGSGKTAVLSERVLRKLKEGISIDQLLILTFTSAAAAEMKERIRKKMKKDESLKEQLEKLDTAYITTFDSFALSIVKKYHYRINISRNISIINASLIQLKKKEFLEEIFNELYEKEDNDFQNLIRSFCNKDDQEIKDAILTIDQKLNSIFQKETYLNQYCETFFHEQWIQKQITAFETLLQEHLSNLLFLIEDFDTNETDYVDKLKQTLGELLYASSYEQIKKALPEKLPSLPKNCDEETKLWKEAINKQLKTISSLCIYETKNEIYEGIQKTKPFVITIIEILKHLEEKEKTYKNKQNAYEFHDIANFAIEILEKNEDICKELKNHFHEIMIDEYQDTNDLQEAFISKIEKNNVYMVGDIKQSIYRFRNANPTLFQKKYDQYSKEISGKKIDLNKNFRSRKEVIEDINLLFNPLMDHTLGGADYKVSHQMIFGNDTYLTKGASQQNNFLEIYSYNNPKELGFKKEEVEIFMIANDIKKKVEEHYLVFDKDLEALREITYQDIAILMDRTSKFDQYKKIFEYVQIPLQVYKEETITENDNLSIIRHLLGLLLKVRDHCYDKEFDYAYLSIMRSYIIQKKDIETFLEITQKKYDTHFLNQLKEIVSHLEEWNLEELLFQIITTFQFYQQLLTIYDIEKNITVLDYLLGLVRNLANMGYTIDTFYAYLSNSLEQKQDIRLTTKKETDNAVKLMTIHKSKGLEFPICYYSGLDAKFNIQDLKERILFDQTYGIITPYIDRGIHSTIYKELLKNRYINEEISEKIRLFYVALTRAKEKMIFIMPSYETTNTIYPIPLQKRLSYTSFYDIISSLAPLLETKRTNISIDSLHLTKEYEKQGKKEVSSFEEKNQPVLQVIEYQHTQLETETKHYSKIIETPIQIEDYQKIELGKQFHEVLENFDFKSPDFHDMDPFLEKKIKAFLKTGIFENIETIYKEWEFLEEINGEEFHGIMDLVLESTDEFKIIDYKLKNTVDPAYQKQLAGYQEYLQKRTHKKVSTYLYSILNETLTQVSHELEKI